MFPMHFTGVCSVGGHYIDAIMSAMASKIYGISEGEKRYEFPIENMTFLRGILYFHASLGIVHNNKMSDVKLMK